MSKSTALPLRDRLENIIFVDIHSCLHREVLSGKLANYGELANRKILTTSSCLLLVAYDSGVTP